jgi:NADPH:quinone reductase-like Zn-dependent oxidoreductase
VRICKTFSLSAAADAHRDIESRRSTGKILLVP